MKFNHLSLIRPVFIGLSYFLFSQSVMAVELSTSGFLSITAGKVLGGEKGQMLQVDDGYDCPCFIGDWTNAGVYEDNGWDFAPDSRAGIQFDAKLNDNFRVSTQIVGHGGDNMKPELTALFLAVQLDDQIELNVGRQRLPLFYYSDFYDVGYAIPWIRVPGDLYGWAINSYNGISLDLNDDLGEGSYKITTWLGDEKDKDDREEAKIYWGSDSFEMEYKNMVGASATYLYDWFDIRLVYMTSRINGVAKYRAAGGGDVVAYDNEKQQFYGLAFNVDYNNVLVKSEINRFVMPATDYHSLGKLIAIGYRMDDFTPMYTYTKYDDFDPNFGDVHEHASAISVRWDFAKSTALKMQYDRLSDKTRWPGYENMIGDSRIISMGVDYVF